MKKTFKFRRWMAFLLALILIATTCISSSDAFLRATGDETEESDSSQEESNEEESDDEERAEAVEIVVEEATEETGSSEEETPMEEVPSDVSSEEQQQEETTSQEEQDASEEILSSEEEQDADETDPTEDASEETTPPEQSEGQNYAYDIYFYYGDVEGQHIEGKGELGALILESAQITIAKENVEYEGQKFSYVNTENEDGRITENREANTVKVNYAVSSGAEEQPKDEAQEENVLPNPVVETYSLKFVNDSDKGSVKVISTDTEVGAEGTYEKGTEVTFAVSPKEGFEVSTVKVQGGGELTGKPEQNDLYTYQVTMTGNMVVEIVYADAEEVIEQDQLQMMKARKAASVEYTVKVTFNFKDNENSMNQQSETWKTTEESIDGLELQTEKYPSINGHKCVSYAFEDGIYRDGTRMYFGMDEKGNPINKTEYRVDLWYDRCESLIVFDTNGGEQIASIIGEAGEKVADRTMPTPQRGEDLFKGWYENKDFSGSPVKQLPEVYPEGTKVYYAKWEEKKAEVTYTIEYRDVESKEEIWESESYTGIAGEEVAGEEYSKDIQGYTFENASPASIILDSSSTKNIITLYYKKGVPEEAKNPSVKIWKKADKSSYSVGETVRYSIEVENTGNCDLENVTLLDTMRDHDQQTISFGTIKRAETVKRTYTYVVQQADAGQTIYNSVQLTDESIAIEKDSSQLEYNIQVEEGEASLALVKEITNSPEQGSAYELGDTITYKVTAKNTGNMTLTDIKVVDELTGDSLPVDKLEPGREASFETKYTVTEADIEKGVVSNTVTGTAKDGNGKDAKVTPATKEAAVAMMKPSLFVEKIVKGEAGKKYSLGDKVAYEIIVKNNGEVPVNNIGIEDAEAGFKESFDKLAVGESKTYSVTCEIQEKDIQAGKFTNTVNVVGFYEKNHNKQEVRTSASATVETVSVQNHLTVAKETISRPANGEAYTLGEKITYQIAAVNDGNQTLNDVVVKDELTGDSWEIGTLAPGAGSQLLNTTYVVQEKDIIAGWVINEATAAGCSLDLKNPVTVEPGKAQDKTEAYRADYTVVKTAHGNNTGKFYELNELVDYTITVTNTGNVTLTNITLKDELTGKEVNFQNMAPGASESFTTEYRVTEDDVNKGEVVNIVTASGKFIDGREQYGKAQETIKTVLKRAHLTISKKITSTPANGVAYALGETIVYKISVVNDGNQTLTNVVLEDSLTGERWTIPEIKPGESNSVPIETSYVVTAKDTVTGEIINVVTATGTNLDSSKDVTPGEAVAYTIVSEPRLLLEKKVAGDDTNKLYKLNEEVKYIITVKNTGNVEINEVGVDDSLTGEQWTVGTLKPSEEKVITTTYKVTEQDITNGQVENKANAWGKPASGGDLNEAASVTVKTESVTSHLKLDKKTTSTPADGIAYKQGETITYKIVALNDGNVTLHNVVVTDPLTEDSWQIKEIAPQQSSTVMETSYVVGEEDIRAGKVVNEVLVSSVDENDPAPEVTGGRTEDRTEEQRRHLIVDKKATSTPANGTAYALGETVTYEIRAWNEGNQTLTNVEVVDELTGKTWTIPEIGPLQRSAAMSTSYVVQEADILKGSVLNVATARESQPPTDRPDLTVEPGEATVPVVAENPSLFAKKEAKDSSKNYAVGEEIEYTISVVNNGNETIYNIEIEDSLTGDKWHIDRLATDGKVETFTAKYTVTEEDIRNKDGKIINVVTVEGLDPKGNTIRTEATEMVNTVLLQESMSVHKTVVNPKTQYQVGDTIQYQIAVKNTGNVTLHNVRVTDQLSSGSNGNVTFTGLDGGIQQGNGDILFTALAVGEEKLISCEYTVVREDANASISNKAEVVSDEITTPVPDTTGDTPIEKLYTLIVRYVYYGSNEPVRDAAGTPVVITEQHLAGESFGPIYSPTVNGYRPNLRFVRSGENGIPVMPGDKDTFEITVVYRALAPEPTDPTEPTPTPGPTEPAPTPGPTEPAPTPGPTEPAPTPGPTEPTPTPGPTEPAPTVDNPIPVAVAPAPTAVGVLPVTLETPEGLVALDDGEVAGAMLDLDESGDPVLRSVEDDKVPLTNRDLGDHRCCILSFLMMLATWFIYTWYTHSMKKQQEKLAELKNQLEEGMLKKKLTLPNNW